MQRVTGTLLGVRGGLEGTQSSYLGCAQGQLSSSSRCENKFVLLFICFFFGPTTSPNPYPRNSCRKLPGHPHVKTHSFGVILSCLLVCLILSFYSFYSLISLPFSFNLLTPSYSCKDVKYLMRKPTGNSKGEERDGARSLYI